MNSDNHTNKEKKFEKIYDLFFKKSQIFLILKSMKNKRGNWKGVTVVMHPGSLFLSESKIFKHVCVFEKLFTVFPYKHETERMDKNDVQ